MSIIDTTTNTTSSAYQTNVSSSSVSSSDDNTVNTTDSNTEQKTTTDVELSTRAQKIQALSEEFFPGGPKTVVISDAFIERLHEYGLIGDEDAQQLSASLASSSSSSLDEEIPLDTLADDLKTLISYLEQEQADEGDTNTLSKAVEIIESFDSFSSSSAELTSLRQEVGNLKNSDLEPALTQAQQNTLTDLETTLSVAAKLSPENVSSDQINHYLDILKL